VRVRPVLLGPDCALIVGHRGRLTGQPHPRGDAVLPSRPARAQRQRHAVGAWLRPGANYRGGAIAFESDQSGRLCAEHAAGLGRGGTEQRGWRDSAGNQRRDPPQGRLFFGRAPQLVAARLLRMSHAFAPICRDSDSRNMCSMSYETAKLGTTPR
jgi:hypothetical protein